MARHDISVNCGACKGRKRRDSLGGRNRRHEYGRSREIVRASRKDAHDVRGLGRSAKLLNDLLGQQSGQMLLDGHRWRLQCRSADRVHGKPDQGCSAEGFSRHVQPEGASLQARHGMAGSAQRQDRGVLPAELQSGTESGRTAERGSEARNHDERSQAHQAGATQENGGAHDDGCINSRASEIVLQGQARELRGRLTIIRRRSNRR